MNEALHLFLLALLGSVIALVGGIVFLFNDRWASFLEKHSVPFASGVLLSVALIGLMPEAVHILDESAFLIVLITFVTAYLFENLFFKVRHHHSDEASQKYKSAVPLVIIGDTIHNFIDGVAIAASFFAAPGLGLVTAISTFLHEVPHEISDFGILLKVGWKKLSIFIVNLLSASTTIIGAFMVMFFFQEGPIIGILLAFSAGLFLYLGASDFLPEIDGVSKKKTIAILTPFLLGIALIVATLNLVPHSHEEEDTYPYQENEIYIDWGGAQEEAYGENEGY